MSFSKSRYSGYPLRQIDQNLQCGPGRQAGLVPQPIPLGTKPQVGGPLPSSAMSPGGWSNVQNLFLPQTHRSRICILARLPGI